VIGRYEVGFTNQLAGTIYEYAKVYLTAANTPSISIEGFIAVLPSHEHDPAQRVKTNGKVDLWDLGPQVEPKAPAAPAEPDEKLKGAELAAAELEYEDACEIYKGICAPTRRRARRISNGSRKRAARSRSNSGAPTRATRWKSSRIASSSTCRRAPSPARRRPRPRKWPSGEADEIKQARSRDPLHSGAMHEDDPQSCSLPRSRSPR
jgi:hypothetical protein